MKSAPAYELRILSGEQRGATSAVCPGDALRIGRDWSSDVVLQQTDGSVAMLTMDADGQLTLNADAGQCLIDGGAELQTGQHMPLALHTSFSVGGVRMAVGRIGAPQWEALFHDAGHDGAEEASAETPADTPAEMPVATAIPAHVGVGSAAISLARRLNWLQRLLLGGAALVSASVGAFTLAWAMAPASLSLPARAGQLEKILTSAGFDVQVEATNSGLDIKGYLETDKQRTELERLLADQTPQPRMAAVWVNEKVTAGVGEVYRLKGIPAEVSSPGRGEVHVHTHAGDIAALEQARDTAVRDVPGLQKLVSSNDPPPIPPPPPIVVKDPGKRIVAVVPGDPGYVKTADGTYYFVGAMLPDGQRLVAVLSDRIQLERDGVVSDLVVNDPKVSS